MNLLILLFIVTTQAEYKLEGHPNMQDCPASPAKAKLAALTCKDQVTVFPRWENYRERVKLYPQNPAENYTYSYSMYRVVKQNGKDVEQPMDVKNWQSKDFYFTIPAYGTTPGLYRVRYKSKLKNPDDNLKPLMRHSCFFLYTGLPPVAVISDGQEISVSPNSEIKLNAAESFDPNDKARTNKGLKYTWSCAQMKTPPTFCNKNPISTEQSFRIPPQFLQNGDTFVILLEVTTIFGTTSNATQTIKVLENYAQISITCAKNCPPATETPNLSYLTYLHAQCRSACRDVEDEHYEWTVQRLPDDPWFSFDYEKTQFGRRTPKFIILQNVVEAGTYKFSVKLTDAAPRKGEAQIVIDFPGAPAVEYCGLAPELGDSLVDFFKIICRQPEKDFQKNWYEFVVQDKLDPKKKITVAQGYFPRIFELDLQLPPSNRNTFLAFVSFQGGPVTVVNIDGTVVTSSPSADDLSAHYYGNKDQTPVPDLLAADNARDTEEGVRRFHALVDQLIITKAEDNDTQTFIQELKYNVARDILASPVQSDDDLSRVGDALTKLMTHDEPANSDPLLAKFISTVCRKMVDRHLDFIKHEVFPQNSAEKTIKVSNILNQCLETNTNPNPQAIAPINQNVTTDAPTVPVLEDVITENYPNYVDYDDEYYKNLENLKEATYNIFKATTKTAKSIALTTAPGEKFIKIFGKKSATTVAKDQGKVLAKCQIQSQGVMMIPSQDFVGDEHDYDILFSTWSKDILWWNRGKTKVATDIVSIEFWHSTCKQKVQEFKEPASLTLTIKDDNTSLYIEDEFKVPADFPNLSGDDLSRAIRVRRMGVPKGRTLRVQFSNLAKADILEVVITSYKFPTAEDFENKSTTVTWENNLFLTFANPEEFDIWCYIGVLANKTKVSKNSISYKLHTSMTCCIRWAEKINRWKEACQSGSASNASTINCLCTTFSILSGYLMDIKSIPQEVLLLELELTLESTLIIFLTLTVTFGIYCLVLLCVKSNKKDEVYYLGDNDGKHRFAYVLLIRTGGGRRSGTTSNVTTRLVGDKNSSEPHLLNYPDPKLRILQRFNQDIFVLSTKHHLGELQKMELWFDCLGPSPDWLFCKDITVYDMQTYSQWYFNVKKRLAVIRGETYVEVTPTSKVSLLRFRFEWQYHTWHLCNNEESFSYVKKVTVLLSTLLMMYVLVLVQLGVPSMRPDDIFEPEYRIDEFTFVMGVIGSFPSFVLHFILVWCFRFQKNEQVGKKPLRVTIICWVLLVLMIISCASILIIFGFWVPLNKSLQWLTANFIGLCCILILYEHIFIFFQSIFCKMDLKYNVARKFQRICEAVEAQRQILHKNFGDLLLRPYFEHLYQPLQSQRIKEKKDTVAHRRNVIAELEDLLMFSVYVIILYVVILANKDNLVVLGKRDVQNIVEGIYTQTVNFHSIESFRDLYEYINFTLIPSMQPLRWYGNYVMSNPALMIDMNNKYIGVTRIRQQRIRSNVCTIAEPMSFTQNNCVPEFSIFSAKTNFFGYEKIKNVVYFHEDRMRHMWEYSSVDKTGSLGTVGEFATYTGGGYLSYLGRTLYNSYANFRKILGKLWIDHKSRSIFVEFLTYNANYNVFTSVTLLLEQSATGYTYKKVDVFTVRMLFVQNKLAQMSVTFFFLFMAWVGMLILRQSIDVVRKVKFVYKDVWFMVDGVIILMSLVCISLFIYRMSMIKHYLDKLETMKHNEFLNYFYLFYLEVFLMVFAAVLVCVATIRLWKFLRFGMMFRVLERTLSKAALPLVSVTFSFALAVTAFAMVIVSLYGDDNEKINTIIRAVRLLTTMLLKASEIELSTFTTNKSAFFYFPLYSFFLKFSFVIFVAVIGMSYSEAQREFSQEPVVYNIKHYVQEQMKYIPRFVKYKYMRQRSGEEERSKVMPKPDKFLYLNSFSISVPRMKTIISIAQNVVRNMKTVTSRSGFDRTLMWLICRQILKKDQNSEVEIFFKGRVKGRRLTLVDERRIDNVAKVVSKLVEGDEATRAEAPKDITSFEKYNQLILRNQNSLKRCNLSLKLALSKLNSAELMFTRINKKII